MVGKKQMRVIEAAPGRWHAWIQEADGRSLMDCAPDGPTAEDAARACWQLNRADWRMDRERAAWDLLYGPAQ